MPSLVALLLVPPGPEALDTYGAALQSFCSVGEVTGCFVMDMQGEAKPRLDLVRTVEAGGKKLKTRVMAASGDQLRNNALALNALVHAACELGYSHGLVATTDEVLMQRRDADKASAVVVALPACWPDVDILQVTCNAVNRPIADIVVRLAAVRFVGAVFPAPVPVTLHLHTVVARPWHGVVLTASPRVLSTTDIRASIDANWLCLKEDVYRAPMEVEYAEFEITMLSSLVPRLRYEADMMLEERVRSGDQLGWAGVDGLYYAARTLAGKTAHLQTHIQAAEIGLEQAAPRVEALHALVTFLRKDCDALHVAGLLAAAAACIGIGGGGSGSKSDHNPRAYWMGDPVAASHGLRDEVGIAAYSMLGNALRQRVSYPNLLTCAENADAGARVKNNYKCVACAGDDHPVREFFAGPCDALLPALVVHDDFFTPTDVNVDVLGDVAPEGFSWLLTLFRNALNVPGDVTWSTPPRVKKLSLGTEGWFLDDNAVCFAPRGYMLVLVVKGTAVLELVQHVSLKYSRTPTVASVVQAGLTLATVSTQLQTDATSFAAWRSVSSMALIPGRCIAVRAGYFYRYRADETSACTVLCASVGLEKNIH